MSLVNWHTVRAGWTPEGHVMEVMHEMTDRVMPIFEDMLQEWLDSQAVMLMAAVVPAYIRIEGHELLNVDPLELRASVNDAAERANALVDEQIAQEQPRINNFVAQLRLGFIE
jgi:hypothetical protein